MRAARAAKASFSSIEKAGDSRTEQENLSEPENSSSWSSFTSLAKDKIETETDLDITTLSQDESGKHLKDEDNSGV